MDELCRHVPLEQIAGLSFRRDGRLHHTPNRSLGQVRDDLYPDRRLRRQTYVFTIKGARSGIGVDSIATSRGCPMRCTFCSFNRNPWGEMRRWTARSHIRTRRIRWLTANTWPRLHAVGFAIRRGKIRARMAFPVWNSRAGFLLRWGARSHRQKT